MLRGAKSTLPLTRQRGEGRSRFWGKPPSILAPWGRANPRLAHRAFYPRRPVHRFAPAGKRLLYRSGMGDLINLEKTPAPDQLQAAGPRLARIAEIHPQQIVERLGPIAPIGYLPSISGTATNEFAVSRSAVWANSASVIGPPAGCEIAALRGAASAVVHPVKI